MKILASLYDPVTCALLYVTASFSGFFFHGNKMAAPFSGFSFVSHTLRKEESFSLSTDQKAWAALGHTCVPWSRRGPLWPGANHLLTGSGQSEVSSHGGQRWHYADVFNSVRMESGPRAGYEEPTSAPWL